MKHRSPWNISPRPQVTIQGLSTAVEILCKDRRLLSEPFRFLAALPEQQLDLSNPSIGKLRPEPAQVSSKQQTLKQIIEGKKRQRKAWAEAVRTWWDKHKTRLYVPKTRPPVMPMGRGA